MADCALAKNGWTSIGGKIRYKCHSDKKNSCEICNRIICIFHVCTVYVCMKKCANRSQVCMCNLRYILEICDECVIHNVQCTVGDISCPVQDYITPKTLSEILQCYSGILTKPCKK